MLGRHQGRAHKLAIEPGSPHIFYTCGEDGLVQHVISAVSLLSSICPSIFSAESISRSNANMAERFGGHGYKLSIYGLFNGDHLLPLLVTITCSMEIS